MDTWNDLLLRTTWLKEFALAGRDTAEPKEKVAKSLDTLASLEPYWAYPGQARMDRLARLFERGEYADLASEIAEIARLLIGDAYRERGGAIHTEDRGQPRSERPGPDRPGHRAKPYFEVLFVDGVDAYEHDDLRTSLAACRRGSDETIYDVLAVPSLEDCVIAVLFNPTIQAVVLRYNYAFHTQNTHPALRRYLKVISSDSLPTTFGLERSIALGRLLKHLRPELDLYLVTDTPLASAAGRIGKDFRRSFYRLEQFMELHLSILKGVRARYEAPFFDAVRAYSAKPTGVFHALPIARGKSMTSGHWARDLHDFYGPNIFLAETSATNGGLDSLLQPRGPIKKAQEAAARAFGARQTFFATNGTSTANKIVLQALIQPSDIVLVDRDCHKSHHYAIMLAGAMPVYLDSYPLQEYSMYGGVPIAEIERQLLALKAAGKLDRVRMLILTNCTFDGITYDPEMVMRRVLAIKPDMVFLWDEAWFAFARFTPTLRQRTGMDAAERLRDMYRSPEYREKFRDAQAGGGQTGPMADPDEVRIRVYSTQSTHKTLTSLRQGSMIHVYDEDFEQKVSPAFHEAFMTHTSTSPNYQIIASLDVGRRQVELEGYQLVEQTIDLAMTLRACVNNHPDISRFFSVLRPQHMIPAEFRPSGLDFYYDPEQGWGNMERAWRMDEFTLDPTRVTLSVASTGMDGDTLRNMLIEKYDIQINKTSRNSALFMPNIGTTRGDVAYLIEVLASISRDLSDQIATESAADRARRCARVESLLEGPPLPNFSRFHAAFRPDDTGTPEGDLRRAFFMAYEQDNLESAPLSERTLAAIREGREFVSAAFITPYPPGFPVLVPGQVISAEIIAYLLALDVKEIHGYNPKDGLRVFSKAALKRAAAGLSTHAVPEARTENQTKAGKP
ncbi:MAG: aminotransferase class I/II-fold pyridoxal phosphate-dependent enzyme [Planctomycetes bacterium]|nr:aminotransferase class I/II-fold pyridoxal phosphate-dependent enzyme [Planctomycetota bacterium]